MASHPTKINGPYTFQILIPEKARGDWDAYIKLTQDLFVELGLVPDDRKAVGGFGIRDASVSPGRCLVTLEAA